MPEPVPKARVSTAVSPYREKVFQVNTRAKFKHQFWKSAGRKRLAKSKPRK